MALHNEQGRLGERTAMRYLIKKGYRFRHANWTYGKKELDLVMENEQWLVVVEVKTRKDDHFLYPEQAVDKRKIRNIVYATDAYVRKYNIQKEVRFDIITLEGEAPNYSIEHIEDAFLSPLL